MHAFPARRTFTPGAPTPSCLCWLDDGICQVHRRTQPAPPARAG